MSASAPLIAHHYLQQRIERDELVAEAVLDALAEGVGDPVVSAVPAAFCARESVRWPAAPEQYGSKTGAESAHDSPQERQP